MSFQFVAEVPLRWVDVDAEGVVNNAVYLSLMEQARFRYFERLGLVAATPAGGRVPFLLAEVTVRFRQPGRFGMQTAVAARTTRIGNTSFAMEYEVRAGAEVLATGSAVLVFVDEGLRPSPVPDVVREKVAAFEGIPKRTG